MTATVKRLATTLLMLAAELVVAGQPRVAIIIDDLGYTLDAGQRAIALPGPGSLTEPNELKTSSVLPHDVAISLRPVHVSGPMLSSVGGALSVVLVTLTCQR